MITVAEHTYEETLLPEKAKVMDAGCRGFLFTNEMKRLGHQVFPVDIDLFHPAPYYYMAAIAGSDGRCSVLPSKDPQATKMTEGFDIPKYMIPTFSKMVEVHFWDLIKLDIEGSEYEVIMSLTEPPAKQLSIEFHLHTKIYGEAQVKEMEDKLVSLGYYPAKHDKTSEHGCGANYWDSLWILK